MKDGMGYHSALKEPAVTTCAEKWMNLECAMLAEVTQSQKEKDHVLSSVR